MPINADKPQLWKADVERSIDFCEAAEGIDWVWEHRTGDFASLLIPPPKKKP